MKQKRHHQVRRQVLQLPAGIAWRPGQPARTVRIEIRLPHRVLDAFQAARVQLVARRWLWAGPVQHAGHVKHFEEAEQLLRGDLALVDAVQERRGCRGLTQAEQVRAEQRSPRAIRRRGRLGLQSLQAGEDLLLGLPQPGLQPVDHLTSGGAHLARVPGIDRLHGRRQLTVVRPQLRQPDPVVPQLQHHHLARAGIGHPRHRGARTWRLPLAGKLTG